MMSCSAMSAENTSSCGTLRRSITSVAAGGGFRHPRRHDGIGIRAAHAAVSAVSASAQRTRITPAHRPNMSRRYEVYTEVSQLFNTPLFIPNRKISDMHTTISAVCKPIAKVNSGAAPRPFPGAAPLRFIWFYRSAVTRSTFRAPPVQLHAPKARRDARAAAGRNLRRDRRVTAVFLLSLQIAAGTAAGCVRTFLSQKADGAASRHRAR